LDHDGHDDREGHENLKVFVTFVFLRNLVVDSYFTNSISR